MAENIMETIEMLPSFPGLVYPGREEGNIAIYSPLACQITSSDNSCSNNELDVVQVSMYYTDLFQGQLSLELFSFGVCGHYEAHTEA